MCRFKTEEEVVGLANATSSGLAGKVLKKGHLKKNAYLWYVIQDIKASYLTIHGYMHAQYIYMYIHGTRYAFVDCYLNLYILISLSNALFEWNKYSLCKSKLKF